MILRPAIFACCRSMSLHIFAATLAFLLFFLVLGRLAYHNPRMDGPQLKTVSLTIDDSGLNVVTKGKGKGKPFSGHGH